MNQSASLEKITSLAKRRGFIYPSSEIYGGFANTYDFGPYGTELKENVRRLWWEKFIRSRDDIYGIDSSVIINPKVWEASGHTSGFADIMVEDSVTHERYRADHIIEDKIEKLVKKMQDMDLPEWIKSALTKNKVDGLSAAELKEIMDAFPEILKSPNGNKLTEPRAFNQLFETEVGIIASEKNKAYLRGEIAQGLFINYKNILDTMNPKLPFGIGQSGKAFRNEITKGQLTFRTLEFDLMEFEYFFDPEQQKWEELFEYWQQEIYDFAISLGINKDNLRWRAHEAFELSFYSSRTEDLEYVFPWGAKEMFACAYRTDYDLRNHTEKSGSDLSYRTLEGKKLIPHVIEPTFGLSRLMTIMLIDAYTEEEVNGKTRVLLKLDPKVAPVKAAIFPLQKDPELQQLAEQVYKDLKVHHQCEFENKGNIGKMYRRHDEIGTPFCITVDYDSLQNQTVTIRERDTMKQERIAISELHNYLQTKIA